MEIRLSGTSAEVESVIPGGLIQSPSRGPFGLLGFKVIVVDYSITLGLRTDDCWAVLRGTRPTPPEAPVTPQHPKTPGEL